MKPWSKLLSVLLIVLAGCGKSDSPADPNPVTNNPPVVGSLGAQSTNADVPLEVSVTVSDETVSTVTMSASSNNPAVIDGTGMVFSGTGPTYTLTLTPKSGETGTATITVTATDDASQVGTATFPFTVNSVPPGGLFVWSELLLASDGDAASDFGNSVRSSGDLVVVGTRDGLENGTMYVYKNNGGFWSEVWKVSQPGSFFGNVTALDGDFLASGKSGTTFLYSRDTPAADSWTSEGSVGSSGSMDLSGDRLLIVNAVQVANVYTRNAGVWTATGSPDPGPLSGDDVFGSSVALDGDVAVIGATGDDDATIDGGAVYVFRFNGSWALEQKLTANDSQANDRFGRSVDVEGDMIVVGVPYIENGTGSGAAYVFTRTGGTWSQVAKVAEGSPGDLFGTAVDIDGGEFVVGAISASRNGRSGAAYHFKGSGATWTVQSLNGIGVREHDAVGASVALNGDFVVLGAPGDDDQGSNSGSVHIFAR